MLVWPPKDPDEDAYYALDWSDRISDDIISSASFTVSSGDVALSGAEHDGGSVSRILVADGTAGTKAKVLCQIVTEDGQTLQQTATFLIRAR